MDAAAIDDYLREQGVPIVGVSVLTDGTASAEYAPEATPAQISQGQQILAAVNADSTPVEVWHRRKLSRALLGEDDHRSRLIRAVVHLVFQRMEVEADKINAIIAKTPQNWGLTPISKPTKQQVLNAILNAIDAGDAD